MKNNVSSFKEDERKVNRGRTSKPQLNRRSSSKEAYVVHAEFCKTFSHPIRLEILESFRNGEKNVSELVRELGISQSKVSQQLSFLRRSGIVWTRRDGQSIFYRLTDRRILEAYDIIGEVIHDTRLAQIRAIA